MEERRNSCKAEMAARNIEADTLCYLCAEAIDMLSVGKLQSPPMTLIQTWTSENV